MTAQRAITTPSGAVVLPRARSTATRAQQETGCQGQREERPPTSASGGRARIPSRMPLPPLIAIDIPRMEGTPLRVPDAAGLAELFFATEVSSRGPDSYDARTLTTPPHRVDREDIRVLNASFRAMIMRVSLWEPLFEAGDLPWLQALDPSWDPTTMDDATWRRPRVADRVAEAIAELISVKGRGVAQATKLLHLKRPALVPVMDTLVARALGARLSPDAPAATRVEQARDRRACPPGRHRGASPARRRART